MNSAKSILILKKLGITETKFHDFSMKISFFLKFHDLSMHGFFLCKIPGFPGEWEPCVEGRGVGASGQIQKEVFAF